MLVARLATPPRMIWIGADAGVPFMIQEHEDMLFVSPNRTIEERPSCRHQEG
ncbi:hypothetical protein [Sphingomonas sp.]|uniref:hypothetical protein n=1 Tax=Sphingomonas sp. TaxID=28214 RepID=UPI0025EEA628|nr:hypothetical protein [Sphingomonas sp.]